MKKSPARLRRWFRRFLAWVVSLALFVALLIGAFLVKTPLFLNTGTFRWAAQRWLPPELPAQKLSLTVTSHNLFEKMLLLQGQQLCWTDLCAESIEVAVRVDLRTPLHPLRKLERVELSRVAGWITSTPGKPDPTEKPAGVLDPILDALEGTAMPSWLAEVEVGRVRAEITDIDLRFPDGVVGLQGNLECNPDPATRRMGCGLELAENSATIPFRQSTRVSGKFLSVPDALLRPESASLDLRVETPKKERLTAQLTLARQAEERWSVKVRADSNLFRARANAAIDGVVTATDATVHIQGKVRSQNLAFPDIEVSHCRLYGRYGERLEAADADCQTLVWAGRFLDGISSRVLSQKPQQARLAATLASAKRGFQGSARVEFRSAEASGPEGWLESSFEGPARDFLKPETHHLKCQVNLTRFPYPELKTILALLNLSVPAPLDSLEGALALKAECQPGDPTKGLLLKTEASADLRSPNQIVQWAQKGSLQLTPHPEGMRTHLESDVSLSQIQLVLPQINPQSVPSLFEPALASPVKTPVKESTFTYQMRFHAPETQPVRLLTKFTRTPILVHPEMEMSSSRPLSGTVHIEDTELELFRRRATVEYFDVGFAPGQDSPEIEGEITVDYPDYTIIISLSGTARAPIVQMESDPPLPADEVASVLLFGAPAREVSLEERETAQSTQALLVSRSVNLLSLYVLASTPIRRIDYNPDSNQLSAQIAVSDKTTLKLGTTLQGTSSEGSVGVRRRLGGSWFVVTELNSAGEKTEANATAWLEWSKRY